MQLHRRHLANFPVRDITIVATLQTSGLINLLGVFQHFQFSADLSILVRHIRHFPSLLSRDKKCLTESYKSTCLDHPRGPADRPAQDLRKSRAGQRQEGSPRDSLEPEGLTCQVTTPSGAVTWHSSFRTVLGFLFDRRESSREFRPECTPSERRCRIALFEIFAICWL